MNTELLLVDNGSRRAASTLNLRRLAAGLGSRLGREVLPVSLQHADRVDPEKLAGEPARVLRDLLEAQPDSTAKRFALIPLFFGESRAISAFVPEVFADFPQLQFEVAAPLCPLPEGEPVLVDILEENIDRTGVKADVVILVDHGSPLPAVTAVRQSLASALESRLSPQTRMMQAVMERREGSEYDFNGDLLAELLDKLGQAGQPLNVALSMLFISPGRHAGEGGDIAEICQAASDNHPNLDIRVSPLVGEHPKLIDILEKRARSLSSV